MTDKQGDITMKKLLEWPTEFYKWIGGGHVDEVDYVFYYGA